MKRDGSFRTIQLSDPAFEADSLRFMTVKTPNLQGRGNICLFVPRTTAMRSLPIYILLHGVYSSAWCWALKGGAHVVANRLIGENKIEPAIIAMPSDGLWGDDRTDETTAPGERDSHGRTSMPCL